MTRRNEINETLIREPTGVGPQTQNSALGDPVNLAAWQRLPAHEENFNEGDGLCRRSMLKWMGASAALALGIAGCKRKPTRNIVSRLAGPEYQKPGKALYYSSTWTEGNYPYGIIVKTVDGRPIKIEGNPDHPVNGGRTSAPMQASILSLYDPERFQVPQRQGKAITWSQADQQIVSAIRQARSVVVMTRSTLGPSEQELIKRFVQAVPAARHIVHESVHDQPRRQVWRQVFGQAGEWLPDLSTARVIVSLECDFLGSDGMTLAAIRAYADRREVTAEAQDRLPRLWSIESAMTLTGTNADHRLRIRPSGMRDLAEGLRAALEGDQGPLEQVIARHSLDARLMTALVKDLQGHPGQSVVLAGGHLPAAVHASLCLLNESLGAHGRTLQWNPRPARLDVTEPSEVSALLTGGADVLICLGVNPVYDWPGGHFEDLMKQVGLSVGHGLYRDETLSACELALPSSHNLESWNDALAHAGVESLCQPVIRPLYESRQEAESLLKWTQALVPEGDPLRGLEDWHDFVRTQWGRRHYPETADAQDRWDASLRTGIALNQTIIERPSLDASRARQMATGPLPGGGAYELVILPDAGVYDGRFANSTWLQELPDPVTRLVWDNAAMISPATARQLQVQEGNVNVGDVHVDQIHVETSAGSIVLPILILPGVADGVIVTTTGYGRSAGSSVSRGRGANAARLMEGAPNRVGPPPSGVILSDRQPGAAVPPGDLGATVTPWVSYSVTVKKAAGRVKLVRTQKHFKMRGDREKHDRPIALEGNLADYLRNPSFLKHQHPEPKAVQLYKAYKSNDVGYRWAMAIDLSRCVGCHACVTACQAENNIPVVGKAECANGREMHWMRIDLYHTGDSDNPTVHHQPMLCQQCENAPCENVCPVAATSHGPEGLNEMVYNRCVGTRYCANNCPYKVRRFNFFDYQKQTQPEVIQEIHSPVEQLAYNPQVTVRSRGVMEKCMFCVQRINAAKFEAQNAGRKVADGQIQTACQQACPAQAILFGNINDPDSLVARERTSPLNYFVLEHLNVKPSVGYKAKIRNRIE